jgi:hypothetical protein
MEMEISIPVVSFGLRPGVPTLKTTSPLEVRDNDLNIERPFYTHVVHKHSFSCDSTSDPSVGKIIPKKLTDFVPLLLQLLGQHGRMSKIGMEVILRISSLDFSLLVKTSVT